MIFENYHFDIVCPCCFNIFTAEEALFADMKDLGRRDYPNLVQSRSRLFHDNVNLSNYPLIFDNRDSAKNVFWAKTSSGDITYQRVCPSCNNYLPGAAGHYPAYIVPVIGSNKPLKSAYLSVLLHNLNRRLSEDFNATLIPADFETANQFYSNYEYPLYCEGSIPDPSESVRPLVYKFSRNGTNDIRTDIDKKGRYVINRGLIMFYDFNINSFNEYPEFYRAVLSNASGIIFIADAIAASIDENAASMTDSWLGFLTEEITHAFGSRIKVPSAVLLTEADSFSGKYAKAWSSVSQFASRLDHIEKAYPLKTFQNISKRVRRLLRKDYPTISNVLDSSFDIVKTTIFAYNSCVAEGSDILLADKLRSLPTEIPFLYLLSQLNLIPTGTGKVVYRR